MRKIIGVLIVLLLLLQYRLWVGEGSLAEVNNLKQEIATQQQELAQLRQRNRALMAEVQDLKQGLTAVEERARSELGMIRKGETFYQIIEPEEQSKEQREQ
ncbi:MAG: cell division protein FtsB [Candidatus Polarisedimenticolaceae bacterium]|nr:cell division protein FtsB [Candidatus Polarisedimenticolaceae bacterium]